MKPINELESFVFDTSIELMHKLTPQTAALWGSMDAQQMIEHLLDSAEVSTGKTVVTITTPADKIEKVKNVGLMSLRPFQREVKNALLPAEPLPHKFDNLQTAISNLKQELELFRELAQQNKQYTQASNVFGPLNYEEWMWFHYKHTYHHLSQFGLLPLVERL